MTEIARPEIARHNGFGRIAGYSAENPAAGTPGPSWVPARQPRPFDPPAAPLPPSPPAGRPPVSGPRRRTAVVLAVLVAVLLAGAGTAAGRYVVATGDRTAAEERLTQRRAELADVRDRVTRTDDERERAEQAKTALEDENADLTACVEAVRHYLWDGLTGAARTTALDALFTECR